MTGGDAVEQPAISKTAAATLDIYARSFVPDLFKAVNRLTAKVIPSEPVPWIQFDAYIRTFAGSRYLPRPPTIDTSSQNDGLIIARNELCPPNYRYYFLNILAFETSAIQSEYDASALYRVPLIQPERDSRPFMRCIHVPGLREASLRIEVGDIVALRQLRLDTTGMPILPLSITDDQGRTITGMSQGSTEQYNAVVWRIDRSRELLTLRVDRLVRFSWLFNVTFNLQSGRISALHDAVATTHASLSGDDGVWARSMLFSQPSDGIRQTSLGNGRFRIDAIDLHMNYEQLKAIDTVVNEAFGQVPFLISGPPGTGKTKTLVELALQLLRKDPHARLLICAPSDPAADTLAQRLSGAAPYLKPSQLLRLNSPSRGFAEVPMNLLSYCCVDEDMFTLPSFAELMRLKVVVTNCRDADILLKACVSNRDLYHLESSVFASIHPGERNPPVKLHWTGLLMDEAAQATELEALIPISVVAPPDHSSDRNYISSPLFVMAGDQHQLGPRTASRIPALQTSLFERLFQRPLYRDHPLARSQGTMARLTQALLPIIRPPFANLIRNYRSHAAILATPSSLFYNDTLEPEASQTDTLMAWSGWQGTGWPVLFACNVSLDEVDGDGGGWYNIIEARKAIAYAQSFLDASLLAAREICIMSPFAAQVQRLRRYAREAGLWEVNIGPLEAFQGLESRLVILCSTRARDRFIEQDVAKGLGVIHEPKRFNVAVTRAKEGLIVLGNPEVLATDDYWREFMGFCWRNGLWQAVDGLDDRAAQEWLSKESQSLSRLERRLLQQDELRVAEVSDKVRRLGVRDGDDDVMWRDGVRAEHDLRHQDQ